MNRRSAGWVALFGAVSSAAIALGACSSGGGGVTPDDSGSSGEAGGDGGGGPGPDGATDAGNGSNDGSSADVGVDANGSCTPLVCTQGTDPDSGAKYDSVCQTRCNGFATNCACASNSQYACFCAIGNSAPGCLTGSFDDCGGAIPSCQADLAKDPKNCGRCGHDCGSLSCLQGVCQPQKEASGLGETVNDWTTDGTTIYATTCGASNAVIKYPVGGVSDGGTATVLGTNVSCGIGITIDATTAYWIDKSTLWKTPLAGGGSPQSMGGYGAQWIGDVTRHSLANDSTSIYFAPAGSNFVFAYDKTTGSQMQLNHDANAQSVGPVGIDATNVYYLVSAGLAYELRAVPKGAANGTATKLATIPTNDPQDLLVLSDGVYVSGGTSGGIWRVPFAGGSPVVFFDYGLGLNGAKGMASDGTNLYWISPHAPYIYMKPLAGGYSQRLSLPEPGFSTSNVLVDANNVYWTDGVSGQLRVLPKSYRP